MRSRAIRGARDASVETPGFIPGFAPKKRLTLAKLDEPVEYAVNTMDSGIPPEFLQDTPIPNPLELDGDNLNQDQLIDENLEEELLSSLDNIEEEKEQPFNKDISKSIPQKVLDKIANYLREVTEEDKKSRQPWLDVINKVKPFLGFNIEEIDGKLGINVGTSQANAQVKTFDTTFSTALLRLWALLRSELLPSTGPVGFKTNVDNSEAFELKGEMIKDVLNEYLTTEDKGFYPDFDRFLLYLLLYGCVFRKIYDDPITKKPISRFIIPEDFLVDNNCSSILESNRLTHIRYLSKREILLNMQDGTFRDVELNYLKTPNSSTDSEVEDNNNKDDDKNIVDLKAYTNASRFKFYETHEYLDLHEFFDSNYLDNNENVEPDKADLSTLPSPYVITRCAITNKIVSLVPNWDKEDPTRERINCFVHYNLFPGFDIYGLGLAQILGSNAMSLTKMQRMAIDAAIFQNFPGGIRVPGMKSQNNDITISPGQFVTLDTGSVPLQQAVMPLPYNGPSPALLELSQRLITQTQQLASTSEMGMPENSQDMAVGTTIALLEVANRMQSAILRTIHSSFSDEIQLLFQRFNFDDDDDRLKIIPISDPSVESTTQRIMKAESLLKIASSDPAAHNMPEIYKRVYKALGITDIEQILKSEEQLAQQQQSAPQPIDPAAVEMADIEQRRLEVESKERIAHLNIEGDGYKTQMNIELDKAKMELDKYLANLKAEQQQASDKIKMEVELIKIEAQEKENKLNATTKELENKSKSEIDLLKIAAQEKEAQLKAEIEILKTEINHLKGGENYGQAI